MTRTTTELWTMRTSPRIRACRVKLWGGRFTKRSSPIPSLRSGYVGSSISRHLPYQKDRYKTNCLSTLSSPVLFQRTMPRLYFMPSEAQPPSSTLSGRRSSAPTARRAAGKKNNGETVTQKSLKHPAPAGTGQPHQIGNPAMGARIALKIYNHLGGTGPKAVAHMIETFDAELARHEADLAADKKCVDDARALCLRIAETGDFSLVPRPAPYPWQ